MRRRWRALHSTQPPSTSNYRKINILCAAIVQLVKWIGALEIRSLSLPVYSVDGFFYRSQRRVSKFITASISSLMDFITNWPQMDSPEALLDARNSIAIEFDEPTERWRPVN